MISFKTKTPFCSLTPKQIEQIGRLLVSDPKAVVTSGIKHNEYYGLDQRLSYIAISIVHTEHKPYLIHIWENWEIRAAWAANMEMTWNIPPLLYTETLIRTRIIVYKR